MTLNPQEEFVIARQLNDPSDVGTNYVRAYIRNAKTDALIHTLNLDDKGSQRFTKTWQVVSDPTGLGLYITITTKVFTDSGYTTPSIIYGIEQHEHLIQDRLNPFLHAAVGPDIDYKRMRKIFKEELEQLPVPEIPRPERVDLVPLIEGLHAVIDEIRDIRFPEQKETDLRPIVSKLETLQSAIQDIPECNHTEVISTLKETISKLPPLIEQIDDALDKRMNVAEARLDGFGQRLDAASMVYVKAEPAKEEPKKVGDELLQEYLDS